jgi:hypothetical protein
MRRKGWRIRRRNWGRMRSGRWRRSCRRRKWRGLEKRNRDEEEEKEEED